MIKIISSYLMYLDANNLYGWAMYQKLPVNGFKQVEKSRVSRFNDIFIKNYNENSDKEYFLELDIDYPKELFNLHKNLPFLPERKKVNKVEKHIVSETNYHTTTFFRKFVSNRNEKNKRENEQAYILRHVNIRYQ